MITSRSFKRKSMKMGVSIQKHGLMG